MASLNLQVQTKSQRRTPRQKAKKKAAKRIKPGKNLRFRSTDARKCCIQNRKICRRMRSSSFTKTVVVQDLVFKRDNVEYTLAIRQLADQTTYAPELPVEYRQGGYGSNLRAFIQVLKQDCNVVENGIENLLASLGLKISAGTIPILLLELEEWVCRVRMRFCGQALKIAHTHRQIPRKASKKGGCLKYTHYRRPVFCDLLQPWLSASWRTGSISSKPTWAIRKKACKSCITNRPGDCSMPLAFHKKTVCAWRNCWPKAKV